MARKARKIKDKWTEKKWVNVVAPDSFNNVNIGYVPITDDESFTLMVYDIVGNKVKFLDNITSEEVTIQKDDLKEGLYFFELSSTTQSFEGKLMIK